jgi:glycine cleavage system transcriptional repressor
MSEENLILVAVGPDRVGLVEKISQFIVQHGCNIEDSKMAVFAGEFAQILLLSGESRNLFDIANAYNDLSAETGLNVWVKQPSARKPQEAAIPYRLNASCMDHPGVVHRLSTTLSKLGINIESLETKTYAAPVSGTQIFRMEATISVPTSLGLKDLRSTLAEIERAENIDVDLEPL